MARPATTRSSPGRADVVVYAAGADAFEFFSPTRDRLGLEDALWGGGLTEAQVLADFGATIGAD
jgi:hypothetical protein